MIPPEFSWFFCIDNIFMLYIFAVTSHPIPQENYLFLLLNSCTCKVVLQRKKSAKVFSFFLI